MKRKSKWYVIILTFLALVTLVTAAAPAMAQNEEEVTDGSSPLIDGLAIIAPLRAPTGQPVTMTVLKRSDATPAVGAGVWALTREQAEVLSEQVAALRESGEITAADTDWESLVEVYGIFLGRTDERGKLEHSFDEAGRYVLIAVKLGYVPGRTGIAIGTARRALGIRAPERAPVGEAVQMTVFEKNTQEPVAGAGVWALTREQAEHLQDEVAALKEAGETVSEDFDWESLVSVRGIFLGRTADDGSLEYSFDEAGGYLLVTVKRGYLPGRKGIVIGNPIQLLSMEVQRWAEVGETVPMTVFERRSGDPVEGAGVWALTREQAENLRDEISAMRESSEESLADVDWESRMDLTGIFLGRTDERGELEHAFNEAGGYALVTVKPGYIPGLAFIVIRMPQAEAVQPDGAQLQRYRADVSHVSPAMTTY